MFVPYARANFIVYYIHTPLKTHSELFITNLG